MNQKSSSKEEEIIEQSLKLLNVLMADSFSQRMYAKEIKMLFELVSYQSSPPVIVRDLGDKNDNA